MIELNSDNHDLIFQRYECINNAYYRIFICGEEINGLEVTVKENKFLLTDRNGLKIGFTEQRHLEGFILSYHKQLVLVSRNCAYEQAQFTRDYICNSLAVLVETINPHYSTDRMTPEFKLTMKGDIDSLRSQLDLLKDLIDCL